MPERPGYPLSSLFGLDKSRQHKTIAYFRSSGLSSVIPFVVIPFVSFRLSVIPVCLSVCQDAFEYPPHATARHWRTATP